MSQRSPRRQDGSPRLQDGSPTRQDGAPSQRAEPLPRQAYRAWTSITTRWRDNDVYGHVNNAVYYEWFDTAVNGTLIRSGLLEPATSPVIGLVVETACAYFSSLAFPQAVEAGVVVTRLGRSSVTYAVGVFAVGAERAAAQGRFTHVYVDRETRRPVALPNALRAGLEALLTADPADTG